MYTCGCMYEVKLGKRIRSKIRQDASATSLPLSSKASPETTHPASLFFLAKITIWFFFFFNFKSTGTPQITMCYYSKEHFKLNISEFIPLSQNSVEYGDSIFRQQNST